MQAPEAQPAAEEPKQAATEESAEYAESKAALVQLGLPATFGTPKVGSRLHHWRHQVCMTQQLLQQQPLATAKGDWGADSGCAGRLQPCRQEACQQAAEAGQVAQCSERAEPALALAAGLG